MANVIKIKRGSGTPTTSNTEPYELAYDYTADILYIHDGASNTMVPVGTGTVDTSGTPVDNDFAKFTDANTIEGRSASETRSDLGLVIGTNVQAYDAGLQSISGLTTAADKMIYTTASDTYAVTDLTSTARTLLDDTSIVAMRTTLGLGLLATRDTVGIEQFLAADIQTSSELVSPGFSNDDDSLMTAAAIDDLIVSKGYGTGTMSSWTLQGDSGANRSVTDNNIVDIAGGTGISTEISLSAGVDIATINLDASINDLSDVLITSVSNGQVLKYSSAAGAFVNQSDTGISFSGSTTNGLLTYGGSSTADVETNLTFDANKLGIGGITPVFSFGTEGIEIQSSGQNPALRLDRSDSIFEITARSSDILLYNQGTARPMRFGIAGTERFRIGANEVVVNEVGESKDFRVEGDTDQNLLFIDGSADSVGIGTSSLGTNYKMIVKRTTNCNLGVGLQGGELSLEAFNDAITASVPFRLYGSEFNMLGGNVGIGTTSPTGKLNVELPQYTSRDSDAQHSIFSNSGDTGKGLRIGYDNSAHKAYVNVLDPGVAWGDLILQESTGAGIARVGIGTPSPAYKLHLEQVGGVMQQLKATDSNQAYMKFVNSSTGDGQFSDGFLFGLDSDESVAIWNYEGTAMRFATSGTEKMRIDSSGNVGIGLGGASPSERFHVAGTSFLNGQLYGGFGAVTTGGTADWNHSTNARSGNGYTLLLSTATNGPGTTAVNTGNTSYYHTLNFEYASYDGDANMTQIGIPYYFANLDGVRPVIRSRYNGTWTQWHSIPIANQNGSIQGSKGSATNPSYVFNQGGEISEPDTGMFCPGANTIGFSTGGTERFRVDGSGILTTGQTRTTDYFQVNKTSVTGTLLRLYNSGWSNATTHDIIHNHYATTLGDYTYLKSAGNSTNTHGIIVASDNYIFMGRDDLTTGGLDNSATAPISDCNFRLDGSGNGLFDGDVVAFSTTIASDARLKENVKDLNYGLKDVLDIRPVSFDWKEKRNGRHDIGVIAQEIEKIIPEVVVEVDTLNSEDTHKTVDYAKLTSVLIKAVQEQQQQINELKEKLNG